MALVEQTSLEEIRTSEKLPSPSGVALEILKLTRDENASSEALGKVLVRDPALAGQILKYANCAQIRTGQEAKSVNEAVVRLGMTTVRQLALGFSLLSNAAGGPCEAFDYTGFWTRSLAAAVGSQVLGEHLRGVLSDEAFTCGLLGQIGRLCLASVHPEAYTVVLRQYDGAVGNGLVALEREAFSTDHNEIGAALFADWGLPETFQEAVRDQEDPEKVQKLPPERQNLPRLLYLANQLADICEAAREDRDSLIQELLDRGAALGLDAETVAAGCEAALEEWQRMAEILDVIIGDVPPIQELVSRARQGLGAITGEAQVETGAAAGCLRIMVVDDNAVDRRVLNAKLSEAGHILTEAKNGQEALRLALQDSPQVIVTDWLMPEMTGLELCEALRRSEEAARTYIIVMTSQTENDKLVEAFDAGADDYVIKPVNHRILKSRLSAAARLIALQERVERDREEIRRFAAALGREKRKFEHLARYDQLTSLPNRRLAMERISEEWSRVSRSGKPLVVMMLDIDNFKRVNDSFGHDAGDLVLRETALAIKGCLRDSDIVCRFGGEEFLAICPEAELTAASMLGDRIRAAVENNRITRPEYQGNVTVSVGVAGRTADVESSQELLKLADEALYAAKAAGRNKVCCIVSEDADEASEPAAN